MLLEKLAKMVETRKIIALLIVVVFIVLSFKGVLETNFIQTVIITVISFYFGKSTALDDPNRTNENNNK